LCCADSIQEYTIQLRKGQIQKAYKGIMVFMSEHENKLTFGQKAADRLAKFAGSWVFIIAFFFILSIWIILNAVILSKPFDIYPYILLNLILSCIAAIQAPVIMMSQNRQEEKDRLRAKK